jgi:hypothetical protein
MNGWQPIETAPRDGTRILGYGRMALDDGPSVATISWNATYRVWWCDPTEASEYDPGACEVSHWQPVPPPP